MMNRTVSVIFLVSWLLYVVIPLCAQNIIFESYDQPHFLLNEGNLLQKHLPAPEINPLEPIKIKIGLYGLPLEYHLFSATYNKLRYLSIENYDLSGEYRNLTLFKPLQPKMIKSYNATTDRKVFRAFTDKPKVDQKKKIRETWKKTFGVDVWYPYYKTKELEDWVKERMSIRIFKLKGKPQFSKNKIIYAFKTKF